MNKKDKKVTETAAEEVKEEVTEETAPEAEASETAEEKLAKELAEQKEAFLRLAAEYDNFRKRSQREKEAAYGDSRARVLIEFLPVIDNFERANANVEGSLEDYKQGIDMIQKQFMDVFAKLEVEAFAEPGEQFDPNIHSAVMHVDDDSLEENVITDVFSKGYKMGDKILRHAMVKVAN